MFISSLIRHGESSSLISPAAPVRALSSFFVFALLSSVSVVSATSSFFLYVVPPLGISPIHSALSHSSPPCSQNFTVLLRLATESNGIAARDRCANSDGLDHVSITASPPLSIRPMRWSMLSQSVSRALLDLSVIRRLRPSRRPRPSVPPSERLRPNIDIGATVTLGRQPVRACVAWRACALTASQAVSWSVALSVERRPSLRRLLLSVPRRRRRSPPHPRCLLQRRRRERKGEKSKCVSDGLRRSFDGTG